MIKYIFIDNDSTVIKSDTDKSTNEMIFVYDRGYEENIKDSMYAARMYRCFDDVFFANEPCIAVINGKETQLNKGDCVISYTKESDPRHVTYKKIISGTAVEELFDIIKEVEKDRFFNNRPEKKCC